MQTSYITSIIQLVLQPGARIMRICTPDAVNRRTAIFAVAAATAWHGASEPVAASLPAALALPLSWTGLWSVQRSIVSVSGSEELAEKSWRLLGGSGPFAEGRHESYQTRFIQQKRSGLLAEAAASFDWAYDVSSRAGLAESSLDWDGVRLRYLRGELVLLEREIYPPGASFGATELLADRPLPADGLLQPTLRVSRSFRIDQEGVIRAREVVKTFDASATSSASADLGSTSCTRSSLTMREISRPFGDSVRREMAYPENQGGYRGIF